MMLDPTTMQLLMSILGMGGDGAPPPPEAPLTPPGGFNGGQTPVPGMAPQLPMMQPPAPPMATPPPPSPVAVPEQPMSQTLPGMMPGPVFEQMGRMGAATGAGPAVPGQVPGQVPGPAGQQSMLNPQMLAALQAIQAPESENRGPPSPPGAPAGPKAIEPGLLFEALMKLGVHPGQIPSLTKSLGG